VDDREGAHGLIPSPGAHVSRARVAG
jgi:hypothetical protein